MLQIFYIKFIKALPKELIKAPLQGPIWYLVHLGDLKEGLNRRSARDLDNSKITATRKRRDGDVIATRRLNKVEI